MSAGIVIKITGTVLLLLLSFSIAYPQATAAGPVKLMFYNVENLFDTRNDTATDDDEFLPGGLRRWNIRRYNSKINSLGKTILAAGEWDPPAVAGFCEVENRQVLENLVFGTNLSKYKYEILHGESPDPRGIDVCLIYRTGIVKVLRSNYLLPSDSGSQEFKTRSVLYAKCKISDDTIHLFVNHWPSRRGGVLAGESIRMKIAEMLKLKADSIGYADGPDSRIIFAGDFNAVPVDAIITTLTGKYSSGLTMVNLSGNLTAGSGTYRYQGTWEMIDQVIVSEEVVKRNSGSVRIFEEQFLLQDDPNYPGRCPYSTYRGYRYQGGYSDHLPVLLEINQNSVF